MRGIIGKIETSVIDGLEYAQDHMPRAVKLIARAMLVIVLLLVTCSVGTMGTVMAGREYLEPFFSCWEQNGDTLCRLVTEGAEENTVRLLIAIGFTHLLTALSVMFLRGTRVEYREFAHALPYTPQNKEEGVQS